MWEKGIIKWGHKFVIITLSDNDIIKEVRGNKEIKFHIKNGIVTPIKNCYKAETAIILTTMIVNAENDITFKDVKLSPINEKLEIFYIIYNNIDELWNKEIIFFKNNEMDDAGIFLEHPAFPNDWFFDF